ncbi:MAG: anthranilate phosphoribosyltransferase [Bacteroidales bacterium]|jgi:anthranilate phosphoribosyltransferase|nr:anthranilate phosphoribosyltransferase [Bacteroidales bacterium]
MKELLYKLFEHRYLDRSESRDVLIRMSNGEFNDNQITAFITVFLMRSITTDELAGFRDALLEMRVPVDLSAYNAIDIVGTGGDNKNTFNISTAACLTVAGAGYNVVKHGNYGSTSISGASNVIEAHGVKFTRDTDVMKRSLDACNFAYLHAQFFSPAMKVVAPVRKALAVRTFFNMLGPLVNPTLPKRQVLGVYNLKLARLYNYLYQESGIDFTIVNSLDGYDEVSLTDAFKVFNKTGEAVYTPEELGFSRCSEPDLYGGSTVEAASAIFDNVLSFTATSAQINAVVINAAFAIQTICPEKSIEECIAIARESLKSGKAQQAMKTFVEINSQDSLL